MRATEGGGSRLPFLDKIQASFGHHDVSQIRSHDGASAKEGAAELGARAFAVGDAVAFASAPDLHTAAHEAAHVVQQRAGHAPTGGLDSPGDSLEQHADAVADAVVAGRSAVALLDRITGGRSVVSVQRKAAPQTTPEFANANRVKLLTAIADYIKDDSAFDLPIPHGRLRWSEREAARFELGKAIFEAGNATPAGVLKTLGHLAYPANVFALVSDARQGPQGSALAVSLTRVAAAFDGPLKQSILRMGARLVVRLDAKRGSRSEIGSVVTSSPLDALVARVMMKGPATVYVQPVKGAKDDTGGKPFEHGANGILEYEWLGKRDRKLWNWIRVKKPTTATAEQVAMLPLVGNGNENSEQAYRIASNPPYFGIPFETARRVKDAWDYAPAEVERTLVHNDHHGPRVASTTPLENSILSDEAALADAPKAERSTLTVEQTLDRIQAQLGFMTKALGPWKLAGELYGVREFFARRKKEAGGNAKDLQKYELVLIAQERILRDASSELGDFLDETTPKGVDAKQAASLGPIAGVCRAYAHAAGTSHLHGAADAALAEARHQRATLPLSLAEDRVRAARTSLGDERRTDGADSRSDHNVSSLVSLERKSADFRIKATRGQALDPDDIEDLTIDATMLELRARLVTLAKQVRTLEARANEVGVDSGRHPSGGGSVQILCKLILDRVDSTRDTSWQKRLDHVENTPHGQDKDPKTGEVLNAKRTRNRRRLAEITFVENSLASFHKENLAAQLDPKTGAVVQDDFFTWAYKIVADEELRKLILSIALQVGVAILTGQVAGAVGATVRGLTAAGEIATALRGTSLLYRGAAFAAQVATQTGTQAILGQPVDKGTVMENAIGLILTSAAMKPFRALLNHPGAIEKQVIHGWGQFAAASGKYVAELVVDAGVGISAAALARQVVRGGQLDIAHSDEWISQGLSFAANRFVHERTIAMHGRLHSEAAQYADQAKLAKLKTALEGLQNQTVKPKPTPEEALAQLTRFHQLIVDELALLPTAARKKLGQQHDDETAAYAEATLQLSGLSRVTGGHIYDGTLGDIEKAVKATVATGISVESLGNNRYRIGGRDFQLLPRAGTTSRGNPRQPPKPLKTDAPGRIDRSPGQNAWETEAKAGEAKTANSVAHGTVRMEEHPGYAAMMNEATAKGFTIKHGPARLKITRIHDEKTGAIEIRRELFVTPGMRFLDLEHEIGHLRQLARFGESTPVTDVAVRRADGTEGKAKGNLLAGIFKSDQNDIIEYHNRLDEVIRLAERGVPVPVLKEHSDYLNQWRMAAENSGLGRRSWARTHFPEIPELERKVNALGITLEPKSPRW